MPAVAVIGGTAVNIRLSAAADVHRATRDIDVVADAVAPPAVDILAQGHQRRGDHTVIIEDVEVDIIETYPVTEDDVVGLDDDAALFVLGHRWALETSAPVRLATVGSSRAAVRVRVATPAGLVAAKAHAAGYPRAGRRAAKHGGDLYDIYRLIETFDPQGQMRAALAAAPAGLGRLIAQVVQAELLDHPAAASRIMAASAIVPVLAEHLVDVIEPFVAGLR
jgi:hypothetical protein